MEEVHAAGRVDSYLQQFQADGGCKKHGGFYLGSIGGPAARLAQDCLTKVEVL